MKRWSPRRWLVISIAASIGIAGILIWLAHDADLVEVNEPWERP